MSKSGFLKSSSKDAVTKLVLPASVVDIDFASGAVCSRYPSPAGLLHSQGKNLRPTYFRMQIKILRAGLPNVSVILFRSILRASGKR